MDLSNPRAACCPQCSSTSVQAVPVPKKNLGAAVLGELALGTAVGVTAGSDVVVQIVCLSCGVQWIPGTQAEHRLRALHGQFGAAAQREAEAEVAEETQAAERKWKKDKVDGWVGCGGCLLLLLFAMLAGSCSTVALVR